MKVKWKCNNCNTEIEDNKKPKTIIINKEMIAKYRQEWADYKKKQKKYEQNLKTYRELEDKTRTEYNQKYKKQRWRDPSFKNFFKQKYPDLEHPPYLGKPSKPDEIVGIICPICSYAKKVTINQY